MRVLLGIGGGIAAFKAPEIVRRLRERGHEVRCAPTRAAASFVAPLTLEVLSGHPLLTEAYLEAGGDGAEEHIEAARWAELAILAPATAHLLARLALGLADDVLTTTLLAFEGPVVAAPAMHAAMWSKSVVGEHVERLRNRGFTLVGPVRGPLASGEVGWGRMADPEAIVEAAEKVLRPRDFAGRRVLITAGPTYEPIDPVRFVGNRSSGKMGFALAAEAIARGAQVDLVAGPVSLPTPNGVTRLDVETAAEMAAAVAERAPMADVVIMAAAVADFRPAKAAAVKIKKRDGDPEPLALVRNPDILASLADLAPQAVRVGFAAETGSLEQEGPVKLEAKRARLLVANDVSRPDIGFGSESNEVTIFRASGSPIRVPRRSKAEVARVILDLVNQELAPREDPPRTGAG